MSLSDKDKATVRAIWAKVEPRIVEIGAEALGRMFVAYPQTKTYFPDWGSDLTPENPKVRKHGSTILRAIGKAVKGIDNITRTLSTLSELHAYTLRVDPANFKILSHNLILSVAMYFPADFTAEVHLSLDKFLANVAFALSEKYR